MTDLVGQIITMITSSPVLVVYLAAGFVGVGVAVFRKVKNAAKG